MKSLGLLLLLGGLSSVAIDAGQDRWKIDFKLSLVEKDGRWSFMVDGSSDLPAGTLLTARVYVLEVVNDPIQGPSEDDGEALVGRDDSTQSAYHSFRVAAGGKFQERVHSFRRKPYSISYRAKIEYDPEDQTPALALKAGDALFFRKADLRVGSDAEFAAELRDRVREIGKDLVRLEARASELGEWIARAGKAPEAWTAWKEPALAEIGELQDRNEQRFNVWAVWPEYQCRMRISGLSEFLEKMIAALDDPAGDEKRLRGWMTGFVDSLDEAYTVIGYEPPLDVRKAGPVLAAYEKAVSPLLEGRAEAFRRARAEGLSALFDVLRLLRSRPRGYSYVNEMSRRLTRLCELIDEKASPEEVTEALRQHGAALQEFRTFAGLR